MVNWEQVINEMDLPELREPDAGGRVFIDPAPLEATITFQLDDAALDYYRKRFPPIDNDML
jgi:hypothetical protein